MVYFITYGDNTFHNSKQRIKQEAIDSGFFDQVDVFSKEDLSDQFKELTEKYTNPRGGGFRMWKAEILKNTFDKMKEGDFCVYTDAGCTVNPNARERFNHYLELLKDESGFLSFRMDGLDEEHWTTEKIFEYFEIEKESNMRKSGQIMSTTIMFRKCKNSEKILNEYLKVAIDRPDLWTDMYNNSGNHPNFRDNRHDQSILSILRKKYGSVEIQDETYADSMDGWRKLYYETKIPFLATRIRI